MFEMRKVVCQVNWLETNCFVHHFKLEKFNFAYNLQIIDFFVIFFRFRLSFLVLSRRSYTSYLHQTTRTFLWFQRTLTEGLPRRKSDWSMTSSCISEAEWIISAIIATCRWAGSSPLQQSTNTLSPSIDQYRLRLPLPYFHTQITQYYNTEYQCAS